LTRGDAKKGRITPDMPITAPKISIELFVHWFLCQSAINCDKISIESNKLTRIS